MSAETVPSPAIAWIKEADAKRLEQSRKPLQLWVFARDPSDISGSPYVALSASHLAKEGGEAWAVEAAYREGHGDALLSSMDVDTAWDASTAKASLPQPSPALAKGGDAGWDYGPGPYDLPSEIAAKIMCLDWTRGRTDDEHCNRYGELQELIEAALSTPTEGPASQTEGMGGEVNEAAEREAFEKWWPKHWPNAGSVSDNVWQGWMGRAALTLPATAEAVPVAADPSVWGVYVSSDGRYTNLSSDDKEEARQIGEDHFSFGVEMRPLYTHPDPGAARLREELERVTRELEEETALRVGAIDRMKEAESKRDEAVKALHKLRNMPGFRASAYRVIDAALASDPAPAGEAVEPVVYEYELRFIGDIRGEAGWKKRYGSMEGLAPIVETRNARPLYAHPAPEDTARLREDLEREIKASVSISETLVETRRLYRAEKLRADDAVKALKSAAVSLEQAAGRFNMMGGVGIVNGVNPKVGYAEACEASSFARAALATEASR